MGDKPDHIIEIGSQEVQVNVTEGSITDGDVIAEELEVSTSEGSVTIELDKGVTQEEFDEAIASVLLNRVLETEKLNDTLDPDWDEPRYLRTGTQMAECLAAVCYYGPVTSGTISEKTNINWASRTLTSLKEKGLVQKVAKESHAFIYAPTAAGWKDAMAIWGEDIETHRTDEEDGDQTIEVEHEDLDGLLSGSEDEE